MPERKTLEQEWQSYAEQVIPSNAGYIQRREMKQAFFSGALSLFTLMTGGLDEDSDPTEADVAYVDSLNNEIETFFKRYFLERASGRQEPL